MTNEFYLFGSKSSQDYDAMVIVDTIPTIAECHTICNELDATILRYLVATGMPIKDVNSNLAVLEDGAIVKVFKGTVDEVNNSVIDTYDLHPQFHPLRVTKRVDRDVHLKILRTARVLLSFLTRTSYRPQVKAALKADLNVKFKTLSSIDISTVWDLVANNTPFEDYLKVVAFQLGQTIGLMEGVELYTKEDIAAQYPKLARYLHREDVKSLQVLEDYKKLFIALGETQIPSMASLYE